MTKNEALKMAIKELKKLADDLDEKLWKKINKYEEALEQPAFDYNTAFSNGYEAHKSEREYPTKEEMLDKIFEATYQQHSAKLMQPNEDSITFNNSNADWVMRITPSRKIEVNEDVEVTEAAQKVLDAMQPLLDKQQPAQEPVLYIDQSGLDGHATWAQACACQDTDIPLYTYPHQWQGLTDDEIARIDAKMIKTLRGENLTVDDWIKEFAHAIEQALKEKNTCS